jgi:spore maturation protein SpmB
VFRASGALEYALSAIRWAVDALAWMPALSTPCRRHWSSLFQRGPRAMLIETMRRQGVDSFAALAAATIQGSTETTFYVLAVYFAVGFSARAMPCPAPGGRAGRRGRHRGLLSVFG